MSTARVDHLAETEEMPAVPVSVWQKELPFKPALPKAPTKLLVREDYVNATKGWRFGDSGDWQEAWTNDRGKLFKSCQQEFGRCTGKVYVDLKDGGTRECGWVFHKRMKYEDARGNDPEKDYYLREVWVHVREVPEDWQVDAK